MNGIYLDTSALGRVLLDEPDAALIREQIAVHVPRWSSELIVVELRRLAARERLLTAAERLLSGVQLLPVGSASLLRASRIEPVTVRSLDAIHLDAAVRLRKRGSITAVMTYDRQLQAGCSHHELSVLAPAAA
ncbi:PIN domain-containing protein [Conexibacter stalactiti]|uniref:Ribonuclease VapC n=1 Tax=Conexibacter stalactiti TaxID=1940611 RepID=A0ABU4HQH4_9ACTN|nr:PIN domain-containing protein [Conexibacter stalactiti]MDW5595563.1 PIN domain-containing protein [Conexibacter stalactiti]MEC5036205.1 PIN domain-containing protein [Conexibacter stalactiti]